MDDRERYHNAAHAMQSGVGFKMQLDPTDCNPKHLRVGVNSAMVAHSALVQLLIDKGTITLKEYEKYLADAMETEVKLYEQILGQRLSGSPTIHLR